MVLDTWCLRGLGAFLRSKELPSRTLVPVRCAHSTEQERKFRRQVVSAAHDLSAKHVQGSPSLTKRVRPQSWSLLQADGFAAPASTAYSNLRFEYAKLDIRRLSCDPTEATIHCYSHRVCAVPNPRTRVTVIRSGQPPPATQHVVAPC